MTFYDEFARQYDAITRREDSAGTVGMFCDRLRSRYTIGSALDVACGTGRFSLALARRGVDMTGVDLSEGLIRQARTHAEAIGLDVQWRQCTMEKLDGDVPGPFDAVLCMGNSIPHLLTDEALHSALAGFVQRLGNDGVLVLHLLNYGPILARRERVVAVTRHDQAEYVRFYDFLDEHRLRFNLLEIHWEHSQPTHRLHETELCPWRVEELRDALASAGFGRVETFGSMNGATFEPERSDVAVLYARPVSVG